VEDFESKEIAILPNDDSFAAYGIKPGHWLSSMQQLKSNKADFYGNLQGFAGGRDREAYRLLDSPFLVRSERPAVLPKGQNKTFELSCFVPIEAARSQQVWIYHDLLTGLGGVTRIMSSQVVNRMRPHQQFLMVMASRPEAYGFLKTMEAIRPPTDEFQTGQITGDYVVLLPKARAPFPLPSWSLMWTNIAYLIWDDFDADLLTLDQQRALIEWLHWGGQLVVSGPNSLDRLRSSFLAEYLPADAGPTAEVTADEIAVLDQAWTVATAGANFDPRFPFRRESPPGRLKLHLRDSAQFIPYTGELVAERRVGRGRIAATAFPLTARPFVNWRCFDNFLNAVVLRRPPREFSASQQGAVRTQWIHEVTATLERTPHERPYLVLQDPFPEDSSVIVTGSDDIDSGRSVNEAFVTSRLRYFSRDAATAPAAKQSIDSRRLVLDADAYRCDTYAGVAGWNDASPCSELARSALTVAAGITVPNRNFILVALGLYLFVLVPANWTIFRAVGRVEWAWGAVPLLAIIGTVAVIRLAQLDIGFARSRTEIAVVETQSSLPRAHVTRYIGLYSSLSTNYQVLLEDKTALAMPFATGRSKAMAGMSSRVAALVRGDDGPAEVALKEFAVSSNSTGMVHVEQMHDLGGGVHLASRGGNLFEVKNHSTIEWQDVGLLRRRQGNLEFGWVGLLRAGATVQLRFQKINDSDPWQHWESFGDRAGLADVAFDFRQFLGLAAQSARVNEGDIRAFGWSDAELPGIAIEPKASQGTYRTLWIGNLQFGDLPAPVSDSNSPTDFNEYRRRVGGDSDDGMESDRSSDRGEVQDD
jgi:hypothetical protein